MNPAGVVPCLQCSCSCVAFQDGLGRNRQRPLKRQSVDSRHLLGPRKTGGFVMGQETAALAQAVIQRSQDG